jgi:hypothetical protein
LCGDFGGVVGAVVVDYGYGELAGVILLKKSADGSRYGLGFIPGGNYRVNFRQRLRWVDFGLVIVEVAKAPELSAQEKKVEPYHDRDGGKNCSGT